VSKVIPLTKEEMNGEPRMRTAEVGATCEQIPGAGTFFYLTVKDRATRELHATANIFVRDLEAGQPLVEAIVKMINTQASRVVRPR
jgi:hypothetical protein